MTSTYYTSLSGMLAANYGLQNTSNNIANMKTPGFKKTEVFYSSLGDSRGDLLGSGVQITGSKTNFSDGTYADTKSPTDLAIVGDGFFVIKLKNNHYVYTRNGQFGFNEQGRLVDERSGGEVQGYDKAGHLVPIEKLGPKSCPGKASSNIKLQGNFIRKEKSDAEKNDPSPSKNKYENVTFNVEQVFDKNGKSHTIKLEFESTRVSINGDSTTIPDEGKSWDLIAVTCDDMAIDFDRQQILFSGIDGAASPDKSNIHLTLNKDQALTLSFGNYSDDNNKRVEIKGDKQYPEGTRIKTWDNDGYGVGKQLSCSFDENGQIIYRYDNNQTIAGAYVGLARFEDMAHDLISLPDSFFRAREGASFHWGRANEKGLGSIETQKLEASNVEPTMEFAQIVVLQRMFQACSQIMNIDKQLLEELEGKS
ncbi:MAG: hypothetical protein CK426_08930 [Legionella sp.]|nr:MAG: hypothetical protein CK423_08980 [Legionella sp.]PJD96974.1 MAG: hypothetical protein CK426_08930 [Legionella sp.]